MKTLTPRTLTPAEMLVLRQAQPLIECLAKGLATITTTIPVGAMPHQEARRLVGGTVTRTVARETTPRPLFVYRAKDARLRAPDYLTPTQVDVYKVIAARHAQPLTVAAVAQLAKHPTETTRVALNILKAKRLAVRERHVADERSKVRAA